MRRALFAVLLAACRGPAPGDADGPPVAVGDWFTCGAATCDGGSVGPVAAVRGEWVRVCAAAADCAWYHAVVCAERSGGAIRVCPAPASGSPEAPAAPR